MLRKKMQIPSVAFLLLYAAVAAWPLIGGPSFVCAEVVDRIVAVINDDIILLSELNQELQPYAERIASAGYSQEKQNEMIYKVRSDILNRMVDQKLTDQEIKSARIYVSEKEIDNAIERIKEANFYTDEELREMLAGENLTFDAYRRRLKEQILRGKLVNREVKSKIVITQQDIADYYNSHKDRFAGEKTYHLRNLMMKISPQAGKSEKLTASRRMNAILAKLKAGQPFEKSGTEGIDLGFIAFNKLSPQLQAAVSGLTPGQFTPVLDTDQGFQIFFVQEIGEKPGKTLEEAAEDIERMLYDEIVNEKFRSWLDSLRSRSVIKIIK